MKKKRLLSTFVTIVIVAFFVSLFAFLSTSIVLKSYNVSLMAEKKQMEARISNVQAEIDTLETQIADLQDRNRVLSMIDDQMQSVKVSNVVDLTGN
ncbi:MAG: hypothetical protein IKX74_03400 [Erysipelotrichaceae bacterium]|nr:hypothetical protein [Erysipelotrichaceae bacterium]MBR5048670.1 hypothetical protein [Erysipelotrichaceae bacterium]